MTHFASVTRRDRQALVLAAALDAHKPFKPTTPAESRLL